MNAVHTTEREVDYGARQQPTQFNFKMVEESTFSFMHLIRVVQ